MSRSQGRCSSVQRNTPSGKKVNHGNRAPTSGMLAASGAAACSMGSQGMRPACLALSTAAGNQVREREEAVFRDAIEQLLDHLLQRNLLGRVRGAQADVMEGVAQDRPEAFAQPLFGKVRGRLQ